MALNAKKVQGNGGNRVQQPNIEPGVYPARLVQIIDLGVQAQRPYQGKEKPPVQELMTTYELVDEFMKDEDGNDVEDKPRWIGESFPFHNLKAENAKSTKRYLALDPTEQFDGDWTLTIGMPINVTVVNNKNGDKIYDNIANTAAMRPKDAANCPELVNDTKIFALDEPDMAVYAALPQWIQDKIKSNLNFKGSPLEAALERGEGVKEDKAKEDKPADKPKKNRQAPAPDADGDDDNPY